MIAQRTYRLHRQQTRSTALMVCLALTLGAAAGSCDAIRGTWTPQGGIPHTWSVREDRLHFESAQDTGDWDAIQSDLELGEEGWTLEFAAVALDEHGGTDVDWGVRLGIDEPAAVAGPWKGSMQITIERRSSDRIVTFATKGPSQQPLGGARNDLDMPYVRNCTAPAALVALAWKPDEPLTMLLNGRPVELEQSWLTPSPGPLSIVAKGKGILEVAAASVGPWRDLHAFGRPGIAYSGWSAAPDGAELAEATRIPTLLDWIASMENEPATVRANALAGRCVYDFATTGELSPEVRERVQTFLEGAIEDEPSAVSRLLPIAVACEDARQREADRQWTDRLMQTFAGWSGAGLSPGDRYRATLLDPERACIAGAPGGLPLRWVDGLVGDLRGTPQAIALLSLASRNDHYGYVWLLPQYLSAHLRFGELMVEWVEDWGRREHFHVTEPARTLSMAAWRLAPVLPERAVPLVNQIEGTEVAADTMMAVSEALPDGAQMGAAAEEALKQTIADWKPRTPRSTIVEPMARLARFYAAHDRPDDARAVALQAAEHVADQPQAEAWATRIVAILMDDLAMPEADEWFERAIEAAITYDSGYSGPESGGGMVWLSATSFIVGLLAERGEIDRALEVTRRLSPERIPENNAGCMARVIYAIDDEQPLRALELLSEVPPGRQRSAIVASLLPKIAAVDADAALGLLEDLPETVHAIHRWRIARASGAAQDPEVAALWRAAVAGSVAHLSPRDPWDSRPAVLRELEGASPAEVLALEDLLSTNPNYFSRVLLDITVRSAGLAEDPIWQRFVQSERSWGGKIPWGAQRIRDWQRAVEEMQEQ